MVRPTAALLKSTGQQRKKQSLIKAHHSTTKELVKVSFSFETEQSLHKCYGG